MIYQKNEWMGHKRKEAKEVRAVKVKNGSLHLQKPKKVIKAPLALYNKTNCFKVNAFFETWEKRSRNVWFLSKGAADQEAMFPPSSPLPPLPHPSVRRTSECGLYPSSLYCLLILSEAPKNAELAVGEDATGTLGWAASRARARPSGKLGVKSLYPASTPRRSRLTNR